MEAIIIALLAVGIGAWLMRRGTSGGNGGTKYKVGDTLTLGLVKATVKEVGTVFGGDFYGLILEGRWYLLKYDGMEVWWPEQAMDERWPALPPVDSNPVYYPGQIVQLGNGKDGKIMSAYYDGQAMENQRTWGDPGWPWPAMKYAPQYWYNLDPYYGGGPGPTQWPEQAILSSFGHE
uniref:Uncharacterized protein n=1 Tax=viral metagenome TaxID=1070528 RepID=A0A6M3L248_9ZZZZ